MDFIKKGEYTYVADDFIMSICHVLPFSPKLPQCKARYHDTFMKTKRAHLFSKMFFKSFIRLLHKMSNCVLCLFF